MGKRRETQSKVDLYSDFIQSYKVCNLFATKTIDFEATIKICLNHKTFLIYWILFQLIQFLLLNMQNNSHLLLVPFYKKENLLPNAASHAHLSLMSETFDTSIHRDGSYWYIT